MADHRITSRKIVKFRKGPPKATPGRKDASVTSTVYALSTYRCNKLGHLFSGPMDVGECCLRRAG